MPHASRVLRPFGEWLLAIACLTLAGQVNAEPPPFVLDLPNGGTLPGTFAPAGPVEAGTRETFRWQSPMFVDPFEFRLSNVLGVRAAKPKVVPVDPESFRCHLRGGDALDGALQAIDADTVTLKPLGSTSSVQIDRAIVTSLRRRGRGEATGYVGPGSLVGWQQEPEGSWRDDSARLSSARRNSSITKDVGAPPRARYDIVLSWKEAPEFILAMAAGDSRGLEPYRFEVWENAMGERTASLIRHERVSDLAEVAPASLAKDRLRMSFFVDTVAGRLAMMLDGSDTIVETIMQPGKPAAVPGRFRLTLLSGDVCLESLRVTEWKTPDPISEPSSETNVVTRDGQRVSGVVASLNAGEGTAIIAEKDGQATVKIDEIDAIEFPSEAIAEDEKESSQKTPSIRAVGHDGRILTGDLVTVTDGVLGLACGGIKGQIDILMSDLSGVISLASTPPETRSERGGVLIAGDARVPGIIVDGATWGGGLAWLPTGSLTASGFAGGPDTLSAVVEYVASATRAKKRTTAEGVAEIGGLGASISVDADGGFVIGMMVEDGAAARDGRITPGDRILAVRPRERGRFVETKGLDLETVMNLLRGDVGTPVEVRVQSQGAADPRSVKLIRQLIYMADQQILDQALATHARFDGPELHVEDMTKYPAIVALTSGDLVPAVVDRIDDKGVWVRSPVAAEAGREAVSVSGSLVKAIELDPSAASKSIPRDRFERLLTVPRFQKDDPPTHLLRLRSGDYLRGKLVSLDEKNVTFDVAGQKKELPRDVVVRLIWLHPGNLSRDDDKAGDGHGEPEERNPQGGLLVQGLAGGGQRATIEAERVEGNVIIGRSPAFGPARINTLQVNQLLIGRAITDTKEDLPFAKWQLRLAPLPRALRDPK